MTEHQTELKQQLNKGQSGIFHKWHVGLYEELTGTQMMQEEDAAPCSSSITKVQIQNLI